MKSNSLAVFLGATLLVSSITLAHAQARRTDAGWYGGVSVGSARQEISDNALTVTGATASSLSKDESGTGFKIFVGHQYNRNFAFEAGYTDLGKFRVTRDVTAPAALVGSAVADIKASGLNLDAVGTLPLQGGFSLFGKIGTIYATTRTSLATSGGIIAGGTNARHSDWLWKWGLGARYNFSNTMGVRLEYERYNDIPNDGAIGKADVGMWSLGLQSRF